MKMHTSVRVLVMQATESLEQNKKFLRNKLASGIVIKYIFAYNLRR